MPFSLMHLDLDYFKDANDSLGHAAGDHVLRTIARILGKAIRGTDILARVGGGVFVMVMPELTAPAGIDTLAGRVIRRRILYDGKNCSVAVSVESTCSSFYDAPTIEQMSRDADAALYDSKRLGRGRHSSAMPEAAADDRRSA